MCMIHLLGNVNDNQVRKMYRDLVGDVYSIVCLMKFCWMKC